MMTWNCPFYIILLQILAIFDHVKQILTICVYAEIDNSSEKAYKDACKEIIRIKVP